MSDLRKALQTLRENIREKGRTVQQIGIRDNDNTRNAIAVLLDSEAALQSQTAPAVPEGWRVRKLHTIEGVVQGFRISTEAEGSAVVWLDDKTVNGRLLAAMLSAPQPDHSPDAGKVVGDHYDLGVALSRHFDELRDSETGHIAFDPCDSNDIDEVLVIINAYLSPAPAADGGEVGPVGWIWETYGQRNFTAGTHHKNVLEADGLTLIPVYPHPAQPRNEEIAADLEAWLSQVRHMEGLSARDIVESAEIYIAQLRASQQEGGEG